ncbi:putative choline dehydrogenase [Rhexocercosporidium sp. MPI-PUGE-AT-0058]|nr:putative choline dehydrogenase [Rhexocercosporidium sp. MPI-PUGE-AT-0058]
MSSTIPTEVDIIIAGGGASGCLLASRLASAHPTHSILLIESGINNKNHPQKINPGLFTTNLIPGSTTARFYTFVPGKEVDGREFSVAAGSCLGGGSSVNLMCYVRASRSDYDAFEMEGWGSEEVIGWLKKHETIHLPKNEINALNHGWDGEFQISQGGTYHQEELMEDFLSASTAAGWDRTADPQDLDTGNAFGVYAAHVLLHPLNEAGTTGLQILTEHDVVLVLFDSLKHATGVEILSRQTSSFPLTINARKLVVRSAGEFGSPTILQRSGVGSEDVLRKIDIKPVSVNPGVGSNYQDHPLQAWPYISAGGPETSLDGLLSGNLSVSEALSQSNGILSSNHIESIGKIRPNAADLASFSPELQELWARDFTGLADKPAALVLMASIHFGDHADTPGQYFTMGTALAYPYSKGEYMSLERVDVEILVRMYKKEREIARRMERYRGPLGSCYPVFRDGSEANFEVADRDLGKDDEAIVVCLRRVEAMWHSLGTCSMKPEEAGGIVAGNLNVYGVTGLKVADLSIVPKMVGANTYSTALLVGEKAAEIIIKELKL